MSTAIRTFMSSIKDDETETTTSTTMSLSYDDHDDENNNGGFTVFYQIDCMGNIFAKYFAICGMIK